MNTTRERLLDASAELFRRQGYTGTGLKQVVTEAKAPFGSLYHFFPRGKEQLGEEVIRTSGQAYGQLIDLVFEPAGDVVEGARNFFLAAAATLRETDYADACPIATVALEVASVSEPLRIATHEVFESWIATAGKRFADAGMDDAAARELAIALLALLEGAFILCRAARSTEALETAADVAVATVERALAKTR